MSLSIAIMHADWMPQRRAWVSDMVRQMTAEGGAVRVEVVKDIHQTGPWPTARRAWMAGLRAGATHHLVLQDDALLCRDFVPGVLRVLEAAGERPVSLYANRAIVEEAREKGIHWVTIPNACWGLALAVPTIIIKPWLSWCEANVKPDWPHDDSRLVLYSHFIGSPVHYTVPSLVQHLGVNKSTMGHANRIAQVARYYIGDESPLNIDWTLGKDRVLSGGGTSFEAYRKHCATGMLNG